MGVRKAVKGVGDFLVETVGEVVAEVVLSVLACLLLGLLALTAHLAWSFSPRATLVGVAVLGLALAHGAWAAFRDPAKGRGRRGLAAVTSAGFVLTAATAVFLALYVPDCGCL
ncbi:lysine transporter LysE [Streptomyces sp. NPDC090021]|uniref:lysine transporter LysE n=1 Tax=Streptomyces sp. NPDC090021 TaxID=3365919 RepID=UPI003829E1AC